MMGGASATVHFHGFTFSNGFAWYDGVAGIHQCPIARVNANVETVLS